MADENESQDLFDGVNSDYEDDAVFHYDSASATEAEDEDNDVNDGLPPNISIDETEDDLLIDNENTDWNQNFDPQGVEFESNPDIIKEDFGVDLATTPFNILRKFVTDEMVNQVCVESDRYAQQVKKKKPRAFLLWKPFGIEEFWRFVALLFMIGMVKKPKLRDYWNMDPLLETPFFRTVMSRDRFLAILRSLHFVNNEEVSSGNTNRFIKLGTFLNDLLSNFRAAVNPGEYLCLDETLLKYKGRLSFKQYNPKKRSRFGIKFFVLVDCATKIVLDLMPYQGAATTIRDPSWIREMGFGGAAVMTLLWQYLQKCHKVIVDNWFSSPTLARKLLALRTYVLGTVQKRRKGMPKDRRMSRKLKVGEVESFSDGNWLVERWHDRREVILLNTFIPHAMEESPPSSNPKNQRLKPASVLLYNRTMGAVDDVDKVIQPYQSIRKTYKWYHKVAIHLLDIAVYNSLVLYNFFRSRPDKLPYEKFSRMLVKEILATFPPPVRTKGRPLRRNIEDNERLTGRHFPERVLAANGKSSWSDCHMCKRNKKRVQTKFICKTCRKRLCIQGNNSCFEAYHTQGSLPSKNPLRPTESQSQSQSSSSQIPLSNISNVNGIRVGSHFSEPSGYATSQNSNSFVIEELPSL